MPGRGSLLVAGTLVGALGLLTACGGDGTEAYCEQLAHVSEPFGELREGDFSQIDQVMDDMTEIEDTAPEDIAGEWETFAGTIRELQAAVDAQGLTIAELLEIAQQPEVSPEDQERLEAVDGALEDLDLNELDSASQAIADHAETECDLTLGGEQ
ncbi:hypothetical protein D9V41_11625 [Aeromicrobium phragmitis]|uniref:Uncharacterized protein n=1 Tax=Aeromicrobium phragmitis TaxID=2478914 RepID=A0A3L8PLI7_9ACTN|nr:hypothetical protein [Aeromicrobium phragmitis]RLV55398.1 hypothetical protein D9V41_11625 [Aeromicrobium phragmitis]